MKPIPAGPFGIFVLKKMLFYGSIITFGGLGLLVVKFGESHKFKSARTVGGSFIVFGVFVAFFVVPSVVAKMSEDQSMSLGEAFAHTFWGWIMMASFLPMVGPWIGRALEPNRKNPFVVGDDGSGGEAR